MIKETKEMYVEGIALKGLNKDFLKGKMVFNGSSKVNGCHFGIVKGFHLAGPENKTHAGLRFLVVETLDTKENRNWWVDLKEGLNPDLYVIDENIGLVKEEVALVNYEDIERGSVFTASFSDKGKANKFMEKVNEKLVDTYGKDEVEIGFGITEVDNQMISVYTWNSTIDSEDEQNDILENI